MAWKKYVFEFISIFVAVVAAFALERWNDGRKDAAAERGILKEISNGLKKDIADIHLNMAGHREGINACRYWRRAVLGDSVSQDSMARYAFSLTRDFISIQNSSGYQSLRSRGLELVADDSLRSDIIALYEYDLEILAKLEEEYDELQLHAGYFPAFSEVIVPHMDFSAQGLPQGMEVPLQLAPADRSRMLMDLLKIEQNRSFILQYYQVVEQRTKAVDAHIQRVLEER